eukprot:TRINITY_DN12427_c0_g2_i1.p1 TRINITY_DN12427_c0_g2~~TRINITY_DN12427_c0_g2_i1.p1  ORF type:complete len:568 (+),score=114.93 TRINITY_DN12427_c0_g2_i1:1711-3414(+)
MLRIVLIATALAMVAGDVCNTHAECPLMDSAAGQVPQFCGQSVASGTQMCTDCVLCAGATSPNSFIVPASDCVQQCSPPTTVAKPSVPSALPKLKLNEPHVADSVCEDIWNGVYSPAIKATNQLIGLREPVSYSQWHPHVQSLNTFAHYNCLLNAAIVGNMSGTISTDIVTNNASAPIKVWPYTNPDFSYAAASKQTLQAAQQHVHRHLASLTEARRDGSSAASHDQGFEKFLNAIVTAISEGQAVMAEFKTCLSDIKTDAMDLYSWYTSGHASRKWESAILSIATLARDCANEAKSKWHYAWLDKVATIGSLVLSGTDVFDHCESVYADLTASSLDWSQLGSDVGSCINTLKNDIKRRSSRGKRDVVQQRSSSYAVRCGMDGTCNHQCMTDLDCQSQRYHYHQNGWACPLSYYHDEHCDVYCGTSDPQCGGSDSKTSRYEWSYPHTIFTGAADTQKQRILDAYDPIKHPGLLCANKMAAVQTHLNSNSDNNDNNQRSPSTTAGSGSNSKGMSGGAVAGVVAGVALCVIVVVAVVARRKPVMAGDSGRDLTSTLIEHVEGGYEPYEE